MISMTQSLAFINTFNLLAYVGPGPGLSMTWALFGLIATMGIALSGLVAWPIRRLLRRLRRQRAQT
jgi:hypothetical protein